MICPLCSEPIIKCGGELKRIDGKPVCENCYFDELGRTVEMYPVSCPRHGDL